MSIRWIHLAPLGILFVLVAAARTGARPVIATPDELPSPIIESTETIDPAPFNAEIQAALTAGEAWPRDPYSVIVKRLQLGLRPDLELPHSVRLEVSGDGRQLPELLNVTAILDGLHDDSIAAIRQTLELRRQADGSWRVTGETAAYRCARGESRVAFSGTPCP